MILFKPRGDLMGLAQINLPCGKCIGCKMERSRGWAIRCVHEGKMHSENCFLTLTYDNDHLPSNGTLVVRDLQLFLKRLHNHLLRKRGFGVRYFGAGEYGDESQRPHYHVLLFGFRWPDLRFWKGRKPFQQYRSEFLEQIWTAGFSTVGSVTPQSAQYVAKYSVKVKDGMYASRDDGRLIS